MKTCTFRVPNETSPVAKHEQRLFVLLRVEHLTSSVSQSALCRLSSKTPSNQGDSHFLAEQTQGNWCKKNKNKIKYTRMASTTLPPHPHPPPLLCAENNEPAYWAGSFIDLGRSQVPALKSLVMQMKTSRSSPLWCASASRIIANSQYVLIFFSPLSSTSRRISPPSRFFHGHFQTIIGVITCFNPVIRNKWGVIGTGMREATLNILKKPVPPGGGRR